jgi:carbon-monoxide dehydrogenase large subunit
VTSGVSVLDRPNSYIGRSVPRPNARRLLHGRGQFVDDVVLPRMAHVAFYRSPFAHARIRHIETAAAAQSPGVIRVVTGAEIAQLCKPWVGVLAHLQGIKSAPQYPLAMERACWQGEAIVAVVGATRRAAEDALEKLAVEFEELPAVTDMESALDPGTPVIHPELGDNLTFERKLEVGHVDAAFENAAAVVEHTFRFGRHTGVTLEPRAILADYDPAEHRITIYHSFQAPHMMQDIVARHLDIPAANVRVICRDVGGSFGIKVHIYPDEMAVVALSMLLRRPVKFVADRLESFVSDIHARDHRVKGRMALTADGEITAIEIDDLTGIGPYSVYPRTSGIEANQVVNLTGAPYRHQSYRARARVVFQNKNVMCQYRAVGHPIAIAVTEALVDAGARALAMDPAEVRRRNLVPDDAYPHTNAWGIRFERLSHHAGLKRLLEMMGYEALRTEQARLREQKIFRGIGLASFVEVTNPSAAFYGVGGARISAQDGTTARLDASGALVVQISVTEQGQGTEAVMAQVAATAFGVPLERVRVISGDTDNTPYGGGTWASRAAGIGGEATLQAAVALRHNVLEVAGRLLQTPAATLDINDAAVVDLDGGRERMALEELARIVYFRPDTLPEGLKPELVATRHFVPRAFPFAFTNGIQGSYLELDVESGFVTLLRHWVVEDCGTVINPQLVDEQIRGGVVQGIGGALFEECVYDASGQLRNGNMADYLVPMAAEMPDIEVGHIMSPTAESELGAKGAGEAGTGGAPGAIMNAINDALVPFGVTVTAQPATPERILRALGKVD